MKKNRILVASIVKKKSDVLKVFLEFLDKIESNFIVEYYFVDINDDFNSSDMLQKFSEVHKTIVKKGEKLHIDTNNLNNENIYSLSKFKDFIIEHTIRNNYDYVMFIDSDILINPKLIDHLISKKKDIISEIIWSCSKEESPQPQIYDIGQCSIDNEFIKKLNCESIYKVGEVGTITLVARRALLRGVKFAPIYNIKALKEDRYFSIRAAVLGIDLYADTTLPAMDLQGGKYLNYIQNFRERGSIFKYDDVYNMLRCEKVRAFIINYLNEYLNVDYRLITGYEGVDKVSQKFKTLLLNSKTSYKEFLKEKKIILQIKEQSIEYIKVNNNVFHVCSKVSFLDDDNQYEFHVDIIEENRNLFIESLHCKKNEEYILGQSLYSILQWNKRQISKTNKLTLAMIVKNEEEHILEKSLRASLQYIDEGIILCHHAEKRVLDKCKNIFKEFNKSLVLIEKSKDVNTSEEELTKELWQKCIEYNAQWVLRIDSDEIFEDNIKDTIKTLLENKFIDNYGFYVYDMWNETQYREDEYWRSNYNPKILLTRIQNFIDYDWKGINETGNRFPEDIFKLETAICNIRVKHLGWSTKELRRRKYEGYNQYHKEPITVEQQDSLLRENPNLIEF